MKSKQVVHELLKQADIKVGGTRPWDITVHDERLYVRVLKYHVLGLGEAYMDGWWDSPNLDETFSKVIAARLGDKVKLRPSLLLAGLEASLRNHQTVKQAKKNAEHHYNIGNDLYAAMLDERMVYSCGYWRDARNLDEAQEQKLDLICRKLELKKGMRVLEIGCGWGGFLEYAAKNYGIKGVGITPALEQAKIARQRLKGFDVKIEQKDYRQVTGKFDRIISIGMFEHVGPKNYRKFFEVCDERLASGGMMLHHTIGGNVNATNADPWMRKYIFPHGVIPGMGQIVSAIEGLFVIEDLHNFGPDYDKTLMAWHENFNRNYSKLSAEYDERFKRMWNFYLTLSAASFRERDQQLWQVVMRRIEPSPAYRGVR